MKNDYIEVFSDRRGQWRFRVKSANHKVISIGEPYTRKHDAKRGARRAHGRTRIVVVGAMLLALLPAVSLQLSAQQPTVADVVRWQAEKDAPETPKAPTPTHNATGVPTSQELGWVSAGATNGYEVQLGTSSSSLTTKVPVTSQSYAPILQHNTKYFWRVVARNPRGTMTGPTWSFTTAAAAPAPTPVNCVQSAWVMASATTWSACSAGQQTRAETWTRTIVQPPANDGLACGASQEIRPATHACVPPPPPPPSSAALMLTKDHLVYEGAFRVPAGTGQQTYEWGGTALAFWPAHQSLLLVGHDWFQRVGEMTVPMPSKNPTIATLPRAQEIQPPSDILDGKIETIDGDIGNGVKIGGIVPLGNDLAVSVWSFYDAGATKQTRSHFLTTQNFGEPGLARGPFQVGRGFQDIVPSDVSRIGGFVSGYMATIPPQWQAALGGTHLTGQGTISIITRTSSGPSATVFTPADLGTPAAISNATLVMGYPSQADQPNHPLHKPMLGTWGQNGDIYNGMQVFRGMVFPEGTRSVLFFGWGADVFCYGPNTSNLALHGQPVPNQAPQRWCYDPVPGNDWTGPHGYPTHSLVFAYDANEFVAVRNGQKKPWEVRPYATWKFSVPFQQRIVNGVDGGLYEIGGAAYDPTTKRVFVSALRSDGAAPLIHVFRHP